LDEVQQHLNGVKMSLDFWTCKYAQDTMISQELEQKRREERQMMNSQLVDHNDWSRWW
jgi:hypothetical protein